MREVAEKGCLTYSRHSRWKHRLKIGRSIERGRDELDAWLTLSKVCSALPVSLFTVSVAAFAVPLMALVVSSPMTASLTMRTTLLSVVSFSPADISVPRLLRLPSSMRFLPLARSVMGAIRLHQRLCLSLLRLCRLSLIMNSRIPYLLVFTSSLC